jgi:hypothetical protein
MLDLKDYRFVKVILASTAIDSAGYKLSLKALNDLKNMCVNGIGEIRFGDIDVDCEIVYSFIDKSDESDGNGDVAYNLYGIIAFSACGDGVFIDKEIERLGANLYDVGRISYAIGPSEKLNNGVSNILGIYDFLYFLYDVRSMESVRNQEKLNEVIKKSDICPFCGSKPIVTVDGENISGLDKFRVTIKCLNIECNVQPKTSFYDSSFTTACDMVLKHWNKRTSDSGIIDTRCCVNCVNCHKDDNEMYYCINDNHYIQASHPFKHTNCHDFEQKDSNILSCVSETTEKDDKTNLCLSCEHADFGPDGCWCLKAESFVCTKLMNNCKYFEHITGE